MSFVCVAQLNKQVQA